MAQKILGKWTVFLLVGLVSIAMLSMTGFYLMSIAEKTTPTEKPSADKPVPGSPCGFTTCFSSDASVKLLMQFNNMYNGSLINPTCYIYASKPTGWDNARSSIDSGQVETGISTAGVYTIQEHAGVYYARCGIGSYYTDFRTVTVPAGDSSNSLSAYNSAPNTIMVKLQPQATVSPSALDLGITTNSTTSNLYVKTNTITIGNDQSYVIDDLTVTPSSTYKFNMDDGSATSHKGAAVAANNVYNEGISKMDIKVSGGGVGPISWVPFDTAASVNEFGTTAGGIATLKTFGTANTISIGESQSLTIVVEISSPCQTDMILAGDECLGNGEQFATVGLIDQLGTSATFTLTA